MNRDEFTNKEFFLDVGDGHQLYVHDWGNPKAKTPIMYLHGGPGSQSKDKNKLLFDPLVQRVIFHDQRGAGQSTPYGSLENNTTEDLIADITKIADHYELDKFYLNGGSWGSCLALAYAVANPERVAGLVIDGVLTGSQAEIDWVDQGRFSTFFPEEWEKFVNSVPASYRTKPVAYHFERVLGEDPEAVRASAIAYGNLEGSLLRLDDRFMPNNDPEYDPSGMRLEIYYLQNKFFMPERHIFKNAHKLKMPMWLVQGRYDMVCPPSTAYELHKKLPNSQLVFTTSGHLSEHETWNMVRNILGQLTGVA